MKIIITGGHLTPAYSFAEEAIAHGDQVRMIGSAGCNSVEALEIKRLGGSYKTIKAVKFDRNHKLLSLLKLPGFIVPVTQSVRFLTAFKPDVVVTFGSFNAVPVAFAARVLHLPVVVHEQTHSIGLGNRLIAPLASWCVLSYESSQAYFPATATVIGNLLRKEIWQPPQDSPITLPTPLPILFITGGNQGSQAIIAVVKKILPRLIETYQVVLQYGKQYPWGQSTPPAPIISKSWFSAQETAWMLHHARLVISRGGANTTAEIMVAGVPSIMIPLPHTSQDEQRQNALTIAKAGAGMMIEQDMLSPTSLLTTIAQIETSYKTVKTQAEQLSKLQSPQATRIMYRQIKTLAHPV